MAMLDNVFVNMGVCGSGESAEGTGEVSLSGVRNFLQYKWPQMDIGEINFYNPRVCKDEVAANRRLTRNQAYWLANKMAAYINTLDIPSEDQFQGENGVLKQVEETDSKTNGVDLYRKTVIDSLAQKGSEVYAALHSLESALTEAVRDNPQWARASDHQALVKGRTLLKVRM